jgi:hypothetical protein
MKSYVEHITIDELVASENGVFTCAQAGRLGIPRDALAYAARTGKLERIVRGAYRSTSSIDDGFDELRAIWKLTKPSTFSNERMGEHWDGVAVAGATAANLLEIGDLFPEPYQFVVPHRFNSRNRNAVFKRVMLNKRDITWSKGLPVLRPEVVVVQLFESKEDISLVCDTFIGAVRRYGATSFDIGTLKRRLGEQAFARLMHHSGIASDGPFEMILLDGNGHVALRERDGTYGLCYTARPGDGA